MARKIIHQLVDDIDGTVLEIGQGESVHFSLDGRSYEIDLTDEHATQLRDALAPFVKAGRRAGGAARSARPRGAAAGKHDLGAVRAWARENGHEVSDRGRVPSAILEAYEAAH
ncbi:histone-like nucleoid-structuring protein Lsr2 [Microbacterium karelineae]|uniref:histone-like nucleoid-structuring protein Lsr2 n=1 Tax=Microbacterium karelineae TaxID=2654283 RepID=UPI0012EAAB21|nr:Lsr2 family protein [Microbacterium karelineae]